MKRILLLLACVVTCEARGQTVFPAQFTADNLTLELKGTARMKVGGLVSIYDAALYLPADVRADRALEDVPKRLDICYLKTLSRNILIEAAGKGLASNEPPARLQALQPRVDQINQWYQVAKPRDHYALTYIPGQGTELALNGKALGVIPGADFAAAYYAIWLGTNCPRPEVRNALLGHPKK